MAGRKRIQYQSVSAPVFTPPPPTAVVTSAASSQITFKNKLIYQSKTEPAFVPPPILGTWQYAWSTPVRQRIAAGLAIAMMASGAFAPVAPVQVTTEQEWFQGLSEPVRTKKIITALHQSYFAPTMVVPEYVLAPGIASPQVNIQYENRFQYQAVAYPLIKFDIQPPDKWNYPWSEPVRFRQFHPSQQQSFAAPVVPPAPPPSVAVASAISSQVTFKGRLIYQSKAEPAFVPPTINEDTWHYPWSEPVRQKPGLRAHLQQAFIAPVLNPNTQITQDYESRWHYAWSEPVRIKPQVPAGEQQSFTSDPSVLPTKNLPTWFYSWSEPVRQLAGLRAYLQQAFIAPVLNPDTQITQTYESRWHQGWSEPVRFRRFPTSEQQSFAFQPPSFEIITVDKWNYAWSEPVRQKPGLKAYLQQSLIATTLDPDTQITQGYESRWHYAWSEPVRIKPSLPAGEQQFQIQGPPKPFEIIFADKWIYAWSEPVRQLAGLKAYLQQAFIAPVLNPDTQITQFYESRWHYAWSEPVRTRLFQTAQQQSFAFQPPSFEIILADKWTYPWSEPVRQKPGLRAHLQQAFIGTVLDDVQILQGNESPWHQPWSEPVRFRRFPPAEQQVLAFVLNPETQIIQGYESRWHYAWSEPVRTRLFPAADQQTFTFQPPSFEIIGFDKWGYAWSEPVRQKPGLRANLQQAFIGTVLDDAQILQTYESPWHQPWSEPVRVRRFLAAEHQTRAFVFAPLEVVTLDKWFSPLTLPVRLPVGLKSFLQQPLIATIGRPITTIDMWGYGWSEPVRKKPGLGAWLQQASILQTPPFPNFIKTINWFSALNEPVRLKRGIPVYLQRFFEVSQEPPPLNLVTLNLSGLETNSDSALFGVLVYSGVLPTTPTLRIFVSIEEIQAIMAASASLDEIKVNDSGAVSIEEI